MNQRIPTTKDMLKKLIAQPSVSSVNPKFDMGNRQVIDTLGNWLADLNFTIEVQDIPGNPAKANLIATYGAGPGGLVLAGHTDTVPYDENMWSSDPFKLDERDGRVFGLGCTDMKGFFAFILEAISRIDLRKLRQPLIVLGTADEESSMSGGRALANAGKPKARYAIIGEPTDLRPVHSHKGIFMEGIKLRGQPGHSGDPDSGISALEGMYEVLDELRAFRHEMQMKHQNPAFTVPKPTLNFGHLCGGDNPNRICADAELHFDFRTLPGMHIEDIRNQIRDRIAQRISNSGLNIEFKKLFNGIDALQTPANSKIVETAEKLTNYKAETATFGTEAPFYTALGMDTIVLGPGEISNAHKADESVSLEKGAKYVAIIEKFIHQLCITGVK
ncbi:MAG: acetylornithine deacetylase [Gammaproteobacteria bacterium]|nr:acetylornithine deacetylase [Gammaproteobacteria bacterium]